MSYDTRFLGMAKAEGVPPPPKAVADYIPTRRVGDVLYVSGQGPFKGDQLVCTGKLGWYVSVEKGKEAARITGFNLLYNVRDALGTLDRVACIIGIDGMVNCDPDFTQQSTVIDGCSELLVEIFGDAGKHTRSAVGQVALAFDVSVEIKMQVSVVSDDEDT